MTPDLRSVSPSEGNMSPRIVDDDDELTDITAQLISETPTPPQSSDTSHACVFDIKFKTLEYHGQTLRDVQYRSRSKRALSTRAKVSWVYQHGADLQAKDSEKLWLCKRCHQQSTYASQLIDAKSTSSITYHLKKSYGTTNDSTSSEGNPSQMGLIQSGLLPPPFNDLKYKKDLVDTVIACDLSFAEIPTTSHFWPF
jgi:hypothetical protein